jgi:hypothetical protein
MPNGRAAEIPAGGAGAAGGVPYEAGADAVPEAEKGPGAPKGPVALDQGLGPGAAGGGTRLSPHE